MLTLLTFDIYVVQVNAVLNLLYHLIDIDVKRSIRSFLLDILSMFNHVFKINCY